jgi:hypothetical protein
MSTEPTAETPESYWLSLSPRQVELLLWSRLADLGGEVSTVPSPDVPERSVMFYQDRDGYVGMICNEEEPDE